MRRIFTFILILTFISCKAFADIDATIKNGVGARSAAMGMAQVAAASGSEGIYWNPASIANMDKIQISTTASDIYGTNYKTFSLAMPAWGGGCGLFVLGADQSGIPETTLDVSGRPVINGYFGYDARAIYLSYARNFASVSIGSNLKYLSEGLAGKSASGIGGDVGLLIRPSAIFSFGAKLENLIVPQMKWDTDSGSTDTIDSGLKVGGALRSSRGDLLLTGDVFFKQGRSPEFFAGAEYRQFKNLFLRGGIFDGRLSFGIGINYRSFDLDYCFARGNDYLEDSHRISLSFAFGADSVKSANIR